MVKKCLICSKEATFQIKDTSDFYCNECAEDNFADLSVLIKVEQDAQRLKKFIKEKITDIDDEDQQD